jgi:tellurium resistance protein TerD
MPVKSFGDHNMAVSLSKGQKVDLTKGNPGLSKITVGLGWDINKFSGGAFDLDTSVFLLGGGSKVLKETDFVFYNNMKHGSGSVEHMGDNRTGAGEGDDEQIKIDLSRIPAEYERISFTVSIHGAEETKHNFGQVSNAFIRIVNEANKAELMRYDLSEDFSTETAVMVAEMYRSSGEWKFMAVGIGMQGGLVSLCKNFGVQV